LNEHPLSFLYLHSNIPIQFDKELKKQTKQFAFSEHFNYIRRSKS